MVPGAMGRFPRLCFVSPAVVELLRNDFQATARGA